MIFVDIMYLKKYVCLVKIVKSFKYSMVFKCFNVEIFVIMKNYLRDLVLFD